MAARSLLEIFLLLRKNALQSRLMYSEHIADDDDQVSLISKETKQDRRSVKRDSTTVNLSPQWVDAVEEARYEMSKIKEKMKEMASLRERNLSRPSLDDSELEDSNLQALATDIELLLRRCQTAVKRMSVHSSRVTGTERTVTSNVVQMLMRELQELSRSFCGSQSQYVKQMKGREERTLFLAEEYPGHAEEGAMTEIDLASDQRTGSTAQMLLLEQNTAMVKDREQRITDITASIVDLNQTFKDIAALLVDQGSVLDRIDYNIEQTAFKVEEGHKQLVKAEKHQKKNRKMLVILILTGLISVLLVVLVALKTS